MFHLLPFAAGIAVGAVAVKAIKAATTRERIEKTGECLRTAAADGLESVEHTAAKLKEQVKASGKKKSEEAQPSGEGAKDGQQNAATGGNPA